MTKLQSAVRRFEVEINGKEREFCLCLNYQALVVLCDLWKIELDKIDTALNKLDVTKVPDVIFAAMCGFDAQAKRSDCDAFCRTISVPDLSRVCSELINGSQPPTEVGKTGPRNRPRRSR